MAGAAACPDPDSFGAFSWIVTSSRAVRTIAWDFATVSKCLQGATGYQIYSAPAAVTVDAMTYVMSARRSAALTLRTLLN